MSSSSIIGVSTNTALYTGKCSKCTGPIADYFVKVNRIEVAAVPTISNNTTAIPAVILVVSLFLFIFDKTVNRMVVYKI
jgi:hypothetical protein